MTTENYYKGVKHVVSVRTDIGGYCEDCKEQQVGTEYFAESINHYIEKHGYKLLHIGTETDRGEDGNPWHSTIAILGK